jgi:hypothetical protein
MENLLKKFDDRAGGSMPEALKAAELLRKPMGAAYQR